MKRTRCGHCKESLTPSHANQKYHSECAQYLRSKPVGRLTSEQEKKTYALSETMVIKDVAKKVNTSVANLKRWARDKDISFNQLKYKDDTIQEVTKYYEKHGKKRTQEKFKDVNVRSIVERYKGYSPRQSRWKDGEIIELVKFAGLITSEKQAGFFNRPLANSGSIRSAWSKKFNAKQSFLHGFPTYKAKIFIKRECPVVKTDWRCGNGYIYLWCDAINFIRDDCPYFIRQAIEALNDFQCLIYGNNPKIEIYNILKSFDTSNKNH